MVKYEVFVTKVPLRDNRLATELLNEYAEQGFGIIFATVSNMDVVVLMQREKEVKAKQVAKKKEKVTKEAE